MEEWEEERGQEEDWEGMIGWKEDRTEGEKRRGE